MVTYLIDSDRVVPFLRGTTAALELVASLDPLGLAVSVITYAEVSEGVDSDVSASASRLDGANS
ncbi:MAG: hypothetical protein ABIQ47_17135 [Tepidiformaceae bacterium]